MEPPFWGFCVDRMLYFEILCFLRFLLDGRSVDTEVYFLIKKLVRGSSPGPPKATPNRKKTVDGRRCVGECVFEEPWDGKWIDTQVPQVAGTL